MIENIKKYFKHPMFYMQLILTLTAPTLTYMGISLKNITTWGILADVICEAISNPYVLMLTGINLINFLMGPQKVSENKDIQLK